MALVSLIYASSATRIIPPEELRAILTTSRHDNEERNITGMLLHKDGNFMQVLEGEEDVVRILFDRIGRDSRHDGVLVFRHAKIDHREFSDWSMAFVDLNDPAVLATPGYSDFLKTPLTGREFAANPALAQKLLTSFKRTTLLRGGS